MPCMGSCSDQGHCRQMISSSLPLFFLIRSRAHWNEKAQKSPFQRVRRQRERDSKRLGLRPSTGTNKLPGVSHLSKRLVETPFPSSFFWGDGIGIVGRGPTGGTAPPFRQSWESKKGTERTKYIQYEARESEMLVCGMEGP